GSTGMNGRSRTRVASGQIFIDRSVTLTVFVFAISDMGSSASCDTFGSGIEDGLRELHFGVGKVKGERRFRAFVLIHAVGMQRVAAAAGHGIVKRQAEIVATQKPFERAPRFAQPNGVTGRAMGFETSGNHRVRLNRLLVEACAFATLHKKSIRANRAENTRV